MDGCVSSPRDFNPAPLIHGCFLILLSSLGQGSSAQTDLKDLKMDLCDAASNLLLYCAGRCARSWQRCWSLNHTPRPEQCVSLTALLTRELTGLYSLDSPRQKTSLCCRNNAPISTNHCTTSFLKNILAPSNYK